MSEEYGSNYYERGVQTGESLYTDYRWIPELTIPLAATLCEQLGIEPGARVLDFGCAKGYLVKALRLLGRDAFGCDSSRYAISKAPEDVAPFLRWLRPGNIENGTAWRRALDAGFDWVIAKDVLEHLPDRVSVLAALQVLRADTNGKGRLWAAIPLGDGNGKYVVPAYELDKTHRIRWTLEQWCDAFDGAGWKVKSASYTMPRVKENWQKWEKGNGFFVCE